MIALLRSRWLLLTVVVPFGAWALSKVATRIEQHRGPSTVTRAMHWPRERRRSGRRAAPAA